MSSSRNTASHEAHRACGAAAAAPLGLALLLLAAPVRAGDPAPESAPSDPRGPHHLAQGVYNPETVYDDPAPPEAEQGVNAGGVHVDLYFRYLTDYVYRGVDRGEAIAGRTGDGTPSDDVSGSEDAPVLQSEAKLSFDLGRLPHPYVGVFANVFDDDPVSRFQEIRPLLGLEWTIAPLTVSGGHTAYIFPEREDDNTAEVWASLSLDDSFLFGTEDPVFSPYVYAAYDYDLYDGLYLEAGLRHSFVIEDTGITLTAVAEVAYVQDNLQFSRDGVEDSGFQHYQVGLVGEYSLNTLLNIPRRYGTFNLEGYLYYTDNIDDELLADTQVWGGVGVGFHY